MKIQTFVLLYTHYYFVIKKNKVQRYVFTTTFFAGSYAIDEIDDNPCTDISVDGVIRFSFIGTGIFQI